MGQGRHTLILFTPSERWNILPVSSRSEHNYMHFRHPLKPHLMVELCYHCFYHCIVLIYSAAKLLVCLHMYLLTYLLTYFD